MPTAPPSILDRLPQGDRDVLLERAIERRYKKGQTLFWEGDPGDSFLIMTEGHTIAECSTPDGETVTLAVMGPGESFGEQSLLAEESVRTATVRALDECRVMLISRPTFRQLHAEHRAFDQFLVDLLAERVNRLSGLVLEIAHVPADDRIVRRVLAIADRFGAGDGDVVELPLTQEQWANLAGTTRPTVNRVLRRLEAEGVVELERGLVRLVDADGLTSQSA